MPLNLGGFGNVLVIALMVVCVVRALWRLRKHHAFVVDVWKGFTLRGFLEVVVVISGVFAIATPLESLPGFDRGWISLAFGGSSQNMLLLPFREAVASPHLLIRASGFVFFALIVYLIPFIAGIEESFFRKGYVRWPEIIRQSIKFGLVHCLAGVPLASGIALILPGLYFGWVYRRTYLQAFREVGYEVDLAEAVNDAEVEAVMASTTMHTLYDVVVLAWVLERVLMA